MKIIKIMHVITGLSTGGAEMMLYKLVSRMERPAFQNIVVSLQDPGTLGKRINSLGIPVVTLGMRRGVPNPLPVLRLLSLLRQERPQILQTWLYHADLLGLVTGKIARVPAVIWNLQCSDIRQDRGSPGLSLIIRGLRKLSHLPEAILVNSMRGRLDHERQGYHPVRWVFIPNGFDVDLFSPALTGSSQLRRSLGLPPKAPLIGFVARFHPMKDHANFLEAAGHLHRLRPEVHFVLVGRGIDEKNSFLMARINSLGLAGQVHLLGERPDIPAITNILDLATSASAYGEGFPGVVGEAMACGVPCVVTDVGDSAYLVGETGRVVPPASPMALAAAWQEILSLPDNERQALGKAARQRVVANFSLDKVVKQYEELYEELQSQIC